jgi:hypothetical protein
MLHASANPDLSPPRLSPGLRPAIAVTALLLAGVLAASGFLTMIGPQIMVVIPLALMAGIVLAVKRSFWSLVCFGYPLTFALISAWIGYVTTPGYEHTMPFAVSLGLGLTGLGLITFGLWKVALVRVRGRRTRKENV